jgi:hypothetical protein
MEERAEKPFSRPMVLVDMEGLVSSGVPRAAFALCQLDDDGAPRFTLDVEQIKAIGWTFEGDSLRPPKQQPGFATLPPHPYALGPSWVGETVGPPTLPRQFTGPSTMIGAMKTTAVRSMAFRSRRSLRGGLC